MKLRDAVTLTGPELRICTWVGRQRYEECVRKERDPGRGPSKDDHSPANHIRGAECEFAGSVIMNLYWRQRPMHSEPDIGGLVEVRSTVLADGRLIVKPTDRFPEAPYLLIHKQSDNLFVACGWMFGDQAMRMWPLLEKFGDPAHFVPRESLYHLDGLREWIAAKRIQTPAAAE